jgi:glycosyltransferase involved in cell wall biosynthesis
MIGLKISIVIPSYNRAHLIEETLQSIVNQSYFNWECIIVDDHSIDDTVSILEPFLTDERFVFTTKPGGFSKGANASRNYGLDISTGEFLYWFDSDDIIHPRTFELCMQEFEENDIDFCKFERAVFYDDFNEDVFKNYIRDDNKIWIKNTELEKIINNDLPINTCSVIWKKKSLANEKFNDELLYAEEWEYFTRLISFGLKGISINKVLLYARKHVDSQTYEFNCESAIRVEAKKKAAVLIVKNLEQKKMLTYSLKRYFVCLSIGFKQYHLFNEIIEAMNVSRLEKIQWQLFYKMLPVRLLLYRGKKILKKYLIRN